MERSRRWLLLIITVVLVGACLTLGITVYSRSVFNSEREREQMRASIQDIFTLSPSDVSSIVILTDGKLSLNLFPESDGGWRLGSEETLPIDYKKLDRYVSQLLKIGFSGYVPRENQPLSDFGLDYPTYEVKVQSKSGTQQILAVGSRVPSSQAYYAIVDGDTSRIGTISDQMVLLQKHPSDFFREEVFPIEVQGNDIASHIETLKLSYPERHLSLSFDREGSLNLWYLTLPTSWPGVQSEIEALINDLTYLSAIAFLDSDQVKALNVNLMKPAYTLELETKESSYSLQVFTDKLGNYYGLRPGEDWYMLMPDSFQLVVNKPVMLLLETLPDLPAWDSIWQMSWSTRGQTVNFEKDGTFWSTDSRMLQSEEIRQLEVWYNGLTQNPLVATEPNLITQKNADSYVLRLTTTDKKNIEVKWIFLTEETALLYINGQNTGFVVKKPRNIRW